jgi:hypothetical protein
MTPSFEHEPPPSRGDIEDRLLDLISGLKPREEAASWARHWLRPDSPVADGDTIDALRVLAEADRPGADRPYQFGQDDFRDWLDELAEGR